MLNLQKEKTITQIKEELKQNKNNVFLQILLKNIIEDVNVKKRKIIIIVNSRIAAITIAESMKNELLKKQIKIIPFIGKKNLCIIDNEEGYFNGICEYTRCPLKHKTRRIHHSSIKSMFLKKTVNQSFFDLKEKIKEKNLCPFYFQTRITKFAEVIATTQGFFNKQTIQYLFSLLNTPINQISIYLINPSNFIYPSKISIDTEIIKYLSTEKQSIISLQELLEAPKNTLIPLPIDPIELYSVKAKILELKNQNIKKQLISKGALKLTEIVEYEQPYLFLKNNEAIITDTKNNKFIEYLNSIATIKSFVINEKLTQKTLKIKHEKIIKIHGTKIPNNRVFFISNNIKKTFGDSSSKIFKNLITKKPVILIFPNIKLLQTYEKFMPYIEFLTDKIEDNQKNDNDIENENKLIKKIRKITNQIKSIGIISNSKYHHFLAFDNKINLSHYHFIYHLNLFDLTLETWEKQVIRIWEKQNGEPIENYLPHIHKNTSLFYSYLIMQKNENLKLIIIDNDFSWLSNELKNNIRNFKV